MNEIDPTLKRFAIIGTREPDDNQAMVAQQFADVVSRVCGAVVRTGGAEGIDHAAMIGTVSGRLEVYLPWASYNSHIIPKDASKIVYDPDVHTEWANSVRRFHPAYRLLRKGAFALHARNYLVVGCEGVLALPGGSQSFGGTGQGIRIARELNIPIVWGSKGDIPSASAFLSRAMGALITDPVLKDLLHHMNGKSKAEGV